MTREQLQGVFRQGLHVPGVIATMLVKSLIAGFVIWFAWLLLVEPLIAFRLPYVSAVGVYLALQYIFFVGLPRPDAKPPRLSWFGYLTEVADTLISAAVVCAALFVLSVSL